MPELPRIIPNVGSFYVENFGCRATQADGAAVEQQLNQRGWQRATSVVEAQLVVLNTCTVTASADQDARSAIRRIHRQNPTARILVTGCYAQRAPEEIAGLEGVSLVVGNSHKHRLAELVVEAGFVPLQMLGGSAAKAEPVVSVTSIQQTEARSKKADVAATVACVADAGVLARNLVGQGKAGVAPIVVEDISAHTALLAAPVFDSAGEKTRPNLKVQDGCNNRCAFCVIPSVRGRSRSLPVAEVVRSVDHLVANGYREIVLSGINLGRWGRDLGQLPASVNEGAQGEEQARLRFVDLLRAILDRTAVPLIRISSIEPMDWSDELIALVASSSRLAQHAHVPLQSGSDRILRLMHRRYHPWHYEERILRIRQAMPLAAIGADVMVGFPGERDEDFAETYRFIERLPFTYLHVFTYSSRPGTESSAMGEQVPVSKARARNRQLRLLAMRKKHEFQQLLVGRTLRALTLTHQVDGRTEALTDNYQKLWIAGTLAANCMLDVQVTAIEGEALVGAI